MVKQITYKGKEYPVRVSYLALKMVSKKTGQDLSKMDTNNFDPETQEELLYWSLKSGANATDSPFEFKKEHMEDVLDECFLDFVQMIPEFFPEKKKPSEKDEESKKEIQE